MSPSRILVLGALLFAPVPSLAQVDLTAPPSDAPAEQNDGIKRDPLTTMFDNFAISGVVAGMCKPPDEALMSRFVGNFGVVQQMMIRRIRQQMPDKPAKEIGEMLESRMQNLNMLATNAVQSKGCTSPEITPLIDQFAVNASMDFNKRP
ncbi:MAG: hypothetical protein AB7O49_10895 [Sphingomonadales bacterium]